MIILLSILMTITTATNPESFKWENRLVILFQLNEKEVEAQLSEISQNVEGYHDRDLKVILLNSDIPESERFEKMQNLIIHPDNPQEWIGHFRLEEIETPMYILVGKDGGKKLNEVELVKNDILFRVIDAMPMRQREMEKDNGR